MSRLSIATLALGMLLIGLAGGRVAAGMQLSGSGTPNPTPTTRAVAPTEDPSPDEVQGTEFRGLPRYPGATRTEYRRSAYDRVAVIEAEYVVDAEIGAIRDFYRGILQTNGWSITDINFSAGEWTLVAVSGEREVVLEIELRGQVAEYQIELSEPLTTATPIREPTATPRSEEKPVVPPTKPKATQTATPTQKPKATPTATRVRKPNPTPTPIQRPPDNDGGGSDDGNG